MIHSKSKKTPTTSQRQNNDNDDANAGATAAPPQPRPPPPPLQPLPAVAARCRTPLSGGRSEMLYFCLIFHFNATRHRPLLRLLFVRLLAGPTRGGAGGRKRRGRGRSTPRRGRRPPGESLSPGPVPQCARRVIVAGPRSGGGGS